MDNAQVFRLRIFAMFAGLGMLAFTNAVVALPLLSAPSSLHFPYGVVEASVTVTNIGGATLTISSFDFTGDPPVNPTRGHFVLDLFTSTCNIGRVMPPGDTCVVNYEYARIAPEANSELVSITFFFNGGASFETMLVNLVADPPSIVPTLSGWLLLSLAGLISVVAVVSVRRRDA